MKTVNRLEGREFLSLLSKEGVLILDAALIPALVIRARFDMASDGLCEAGCKPKPYNRAKGHQAMKFLIKDESLGRIPSMAAVLQCRDLPHDEEPSTRLDLQYLQGYLGKPR